MHRPYANIHLRFFQVAYRLHFRGNHFGSTVYEAVIPRNVRVAEAPSYGKPVLIYDLKCTGSQAYLQLAKEVVGRERARRARLAA